MPKLPDMTADAIHRRQELTKQAQTERNAIQPVVEKPKIRIAKKR